MASSCITVASLEGDTLERCTVIISEEETVAQRLQTGSSSGQEGELCWPVSKAVRTQEAVNSIPMEQNTSTGFSSRTCSLGSCEFLDPVIA